MSKDQPQDGAPTGPADIEAELAREREAKQQMRERLRNTEALAAESHALRARMAQELERVTAERDRLKAQSATAAAIGEALSVDPPAATGSAAAAAPATKPAIGPRAEPAGPVPVARPAAAAARPAAGPSVKEPVVGAGAGAGAVPPRASEWSTRPPTTKGRGGPWKALGLLAGVAACAAVVAWLTGTMPIDGLGGPSSAVTAHADQPAAETPATPAPAASVALAGAPHDAISASAADALDRAASAVAASRGAVESGPAVALAPVSSPEALVAAAPTAAAPVSSTVVAAPAPAVTPGLPDRLRKTLDAEGIAAPVEIDARSGRVAVSDPAADNATRDRTDMLIRAVYAGASLPEPQIEHRWLSAPRAGRTASAAAVAVAPQVATTDATAAAKRVPPAAADHRRREARPTEAVAAAEEARIILPMGRITAACKTSAGGTAAAKPRGAEMNACMRRSCCSGGNRQSEECRAYAHAYPFTCQAG